MSPIDAGDHRAVGDDHRNRMEHGGNIVAVQCDQRQGMTQDVGFVQDGVFAVRCAPCLFQGRNERDAVDSDHDDHGPGRVFRNDPWDQSQQGGDQEPGIPAGDVFESIFQ